MIGQTISHYKILEKLGEGGMGVVYKAHDVSLDRFVALKFLPERASVNAETKARFLQEAKAAAALNHNNICTVYGVDEADGKMFIAMECIEGGTLRERLPFAKIDEAVSIAAQIGEALQEAHSKGIVHRDIKADNIMLTSKGQAKVMDFGLAKLRGTLKLTRTSSTVGTLGYMAPEQIQGGEVDARSDIFAFGVVLFEMLTGHLPFRGEHEAAMMYSILHEEPESVQKHRQDVSSEIDRIIHRALEKDPEDRYQHVDDMVSELRRTQKKTSKVMRSSSYAVPQPQAPGAPSGTVSQTASHTESPLSATPKSRTIRIVALAGAAVVVLAALGWFLFGRPSLSVNPNMATHVLQVPFTQYSYPSFSPDGKWIAFPAADANGKWDIYYMHVNGGEPRKITSDATTFIQQSAQISPDGSQIVYDRPNADRTSYDLFAISSLGGTSRKLAERTSSPLWRPDGQRVGFIRTLNLRQRSQSGLMEFWTVAADGSDLRREYIDSLFVTKGGNYRFSFCWSPDGRSIAWIRSQSAFSQVLVVHELASKNDRQLTKGGENLDAMAWTKDDRIVFSSNRGGNTNLWAISASGGEAVQVTKGGGPDIGLSIAASGNELVYLQQQRVGYLWTANIDGSSLRQISFDDREIRGPSFSPDRKRIAFILNDPDPLKKTSDIYIVDRDGNNRRRLTTGNPTALVTGWSPDGERIMYSVSPTGQGSDTGSVRIYVVDADNPGAPKFAGNAYGSFWLDDDHILSTDLVRSYIVTVSTAQTRRFFTDSIIVYSMWDGRHIAYLDLHRATAGWWVAEIEPTTASNLVKQAGELIMPVLRGSPKKIDFAPSLRGPWTSRPSVSGSVLQYAGEGKARLLSFARGNEAVLAARFPGLTNASLELSPDGKEMVFVTPRLSSRLILLENIFK